jgi:hypothetical protein
LPVPDKIRHGLGCLQVPRARFRLGRFESLSILSSFWYFPFISSWCIILKQGEFMTTGSILLASGVVLLGCIVLRGINPIDSAIEGVIWILYRIAALSAAIARTTDVAYLRLKREYRNSVSDISEQRAALHHAEEMRMATTAARTEAQALKLVAN